jgi:hypothetical protein
VLAVGSLIFSSFLHAAYMLRGLINHFFGNKVFNNNIGLFLNKVWLIALIITSILFLIALEISVFELPFSTNSNTILYTCWSFLLIAFIFINITFLTSFAKKDNNAD